MSVPIITFFTRKNCPLCDVAMDELRAALGNRAFDLRKVNIDIEREHHDDYDHHIPVICVNGVEVCRHRLDRDKFLAAIDHPT